MAFPSGIQRFFVVALMMIVTTTEVFAQNIGVKWMGETCQEIGEVVNDGGDVVRTFVAKNSGEYGWKICNVYTSCGCTRAEWDAEKLVRTNDTILVTLRFDPSGKSGEVEEKATVVFTDGEEKHNEYLSLHGMVKLSDAAQRQRHPYDMGGGIFASRSEIDFGEITINDEPIRVVSLWDGKENSVIEVAWRKQSGYGLQEQSFEIKKGEGLCSNVTNGNKRKNGEIKLKAVVLPDFSKLSDNERQEAPQAVIPNRVKAEKDGTVTIEISNSGIAPLEILSIDNAELLAATLPIKINKGEIRKIKLKPFAERLTLICNDPKKPRQSVRIPSNNR